jgi:hypothetical protein
MSRRIDGIAVALALAFSLPGVGAAAKDAEAEPVAAQATGGARDAYAAPLATALEMVHDRYAPSAKPIPEDVRDALAAEFGPELVRARYVVSQLALSVLTTIDQFQGTTLRKGLHAATVDDLILFSSEPSISDLWMWAHELHHVQQYEERGTIYQFALWYVNECEAVEQAADDRANRALGKSIHPRHCL